MPLNESRKVDSSHSSNLVKDEAVKDPPPPTGKEPNYDRKSTTTQTQILLDPSPDSSEDSVFERELKKNKVKRTIWESQT